MFVKSLDDLPDTYGCKLCEKDKPIDEIIVIHDRRKSGYRVRCRCKACHNARQRGHRRPWKTQYLRRWRKENRQLNESYWRKATADRARRNRLGYAHFLANHHAILIQGRLRRRLGEHISLAEARALLSKYGPCYPTQMGLTPRGRRECERIRARLRRVEDKPCLIDIRMMVYAEGMHIKPQKQPIPFLHAAERLRRYHAERKAA
jgi:hypothetical protein